MASFIAKQYIIPTLRISPGQCLDTILRDVRAKQRFFGSNPVAVDPATVRGSDVDGKLLVDALRQLGLKIIDLPSSHAHDVPGSSGCQQGMSPLSESPAAPTDADPSSFRRTPRARPAVSAEIPPSSPATGAMPRFSHAQTSSSIVRRPLVIDGNVRSGQQIYAQGRDLVVTGNVHSGAEILSDGNIHVYGKLAGRALAGLRAEVDSEAFRCVILCQRFSPELVAVGNVYRLCEVVPDGAAADAPVMVSLDETFETVVFRTLRAEGAAAAVPPLR